MQRKRLMSLFAALVVAAAFAGGTVPAGVAQTGGCIDPNYCPQEPSALPPGSAPAPIGSPERALQLKKCVKKAKAKFGGNTVKKKAAIKKCKKKYGS